MVGERTHYIHLLKERLSQRQRTNPNYSLRAFARDISVHPATLSQVLKGHRPLPLKNAKKVAVRLGLSPKDHTLFLESFFQSKTKLDEIAIDVSDERVMLDESYFNVIAEWEHYAVLMLFDVAGFEPTAAEIAERLEITPNRAEVVLSNLFTAGLLKTAENLKIERTHSRLRTTEDVSSIALKRSHRETLEMGIKKLDETEIELRDFSAMTIAVDRSRLDEAKAIIREFRQKMASLLRDGEKTDVYQLAIQFYPMTRTSNSKTKKQEKTK